jgi:micrococcal nuclease
MKEFLKLKSKAQMISQSISLRLVAITILGIAIGLGIGYPLWHTADVPGMEQALVVRVIDGDTIELADGTRVRYLGIDTPESGEYYASEATAKNKELVEGKIVELQRGERDCDEYGRLLRYVYVDGVFVNAELIAQGYAWAYIFNSDERYSQILVQLEQYAKMRERGLWGQ